ncbi:hypothetical protein KZC51_03660 [Microbacterium sp. SSW1-49]|uniref:Uncharacterized protein n=1 Tax=Microbacterium croceum TaxID=2851645 RepID=A0ABT0FB19_9MICO|nr:hypothetical protein [Microbacterium croceum]MCK2035223.1 hypothetical protein [Microbacterium croceum]
MTGPRLRVEGRADEVPVEVLVSGVPGPDAYAVVLLTASGIRSVVLPMEDPNESLGFHGPVGAEAAREQTNIRASARTRDWGSGD